MLKTPIISAVFVILTSCGGEYICKYHGSSINYCDDGNKTIAIQTPFDAPQVDGDQMTANEILQTQTYVESCLGQGLDLSTIKFKVLQSQADVLTACAEPPNANVVACTHAATETTIYVNENYADPITRTETAAHELGHWYYWATTGDADHNHTHNEWFGRWDGEYGGVGVEGSVADCAMFRAEQGE